MNPMVSSATEGLTYTLDVLHKRPNHPTKQMQRNTLLINPPSTTPRNNQVLTTQFASLYMDRLVLLNVLCHIFARRLSHFINTHFCIVAFHSLCAQLWISFVSYTQLLSSSRVTTLILFTLHAVVLCLHPLHRSHCTKHHPN